MMAATARFWGKARPLEGRSLATHPAVAHALDVAAVAMLMPRPVATAIPRQTLGFLVALHDVGKFSCSFQALAPEHWPADVLGPLPARAPGGPRHDAMGLYLLRHEMEGRLDPVLPPRRPGVRNWTASDRNHLFQALAGHHGRPAEPLDGRPHASALSPACIDAARAFADAMLDVFRPPPLPLAAVDPALLGWDLAGIVTLADWVGSRQQWFPYCAAEAVADPAAYFWNTALPQAAAALSAAGLAAPSVAPFAGVRRLFPAVTQPSPAQDWAETVALPPGPVLVVVEDVTGSGKTEAAVTLAHRLLADGRAHGLFLALPTTATANAMYGRMAAAYAALFAEGARPSLALAHGRAALDPRFAAAMEGGVAQERRMGDAGDPADMPAEAHCAAWLGDDRRRALLAQVGVGTIDQALLAVLPVRHAALRMQGLKGKVLVVDEAHAFDPYMRRELVELLRFHAALGGSAILLSATLTRQLRQQLTDAFRDGLHQPSLPLANVQYPLMTVASASAVIEYPRPIRAGLGRDVTVTRLPDAEAALGRIVLAARAGAAVAWIRNTVDDAIEAADAVRAAGLEPMLFHARFAMVDRLAVEDAVLRRFGPRGTDRAGVLIATQVVEQSLDLDFDLLCTELAPVDLLIQRAGRLWRHKRGPRPVDRAELLVVSPEPVDDPAADWVRATQPGTAAVYRDPALLWRGARALFGRGMIRTPDDMRPLIEAAADADGMGVPPALAAQAGRADGKGLSDAGLAAQNVLKLREGYARQNGAWEPETHTPTRLEDRPHVTLRLARLRDGAVVPYADDPDPRRAWALSEVSVAEHRVADCPVPPALAEVAEKARAQWGRWERESPRVLLAVMTEAGAGFTFRIRTGAGGEASCRYDPGRGLLMNDPGSG